MRVRTETPRIAAARRAALALVLERYHDPDWGRHDRPETEFEHWCRRYGVTAPESVRRPGPLARDADPHPLIRVDLNRCILCTRCVRACGEVQGGSSGAWPGAAEDDAHGGGRRDGACWRRAASLAAPAPRSVPDRGARGPLSMRPRASQSGCVDHAVPVLRRGLLLTTWERQGGGASAVVTSNPDAPGERHPPVREGPLRLGLRPPPRAARRGRACAATCSRASHARAARAARRVGRDRLGRSRSTWCARRLAAIRRRERARTPSACSPRPSAPTRRTTCCRSSRAR